MHPLTYFYPTGHEAHFSPNHPERPERVEAIRQALRAASWWNPHPKLEPLKLPERVLTAIHTPRHLASVEATSRRGGAVDADTYLTPQTWGLALQAAGGAAAVAAAVWQREAQRGFALTRPPGHHATADRAMGFCLLNNIALAAEYLRQEKGALRLAIVDIDLHHGNGTQDIFYARDDVLFFSTHQSPLYPGTGHYVEMGTQRGKDLTVNIPLPPLSGDMAFAAATNEIIVPLLERFAPEMVLVSAGFDTHWRDPLGYLLLSAKGYGKVIARLTAFADEYCDGRIALFLEGGYDLEGGSASAAAAVAALLDKPFTDPVGPSDWPERDDWQHVLREIRNQWGI